MWTLLGIAMRNVARNRRRTIITLAALFVGTGVMVSMRGLLNGLQRALVTNVADGQTGTVQVHRRGYMANVVSTPLSLDFPVDEVRRAIAGVPGAGATAARILFSGMVSAGDRTQLVAVMAFDLEAERAVTPLREQTFAPGTRFFDQAPLPDGSPPQGIVLTADLARAVELRPAGEASLLASDRDGVLSGEPVRMAGIVNVALPGEKKIALVPLALAQRLLKMPGRATEMAVRVEPLERADAVAAALRARLGAGYEVHTWAEVAFFVRQAMARQNFVIRLIAYAFLLLMLLGVANTMLMSVIERTREIGTMMAVGVRRSRILALIVCEALVLGAAGGALGAAAGHAVVTLLGRHGIAFHFPGSPVPFVLVPFATPAYLAQVLLLATAGAGLFALYPALRASRLRPVEALAGRA